MNDTATRGKSGWFDATARQRVTGLLDPGSFTEFIGPSERVQSPHLKMFDLLRHLTTGSSSGAAS